MNFISNLYFFWICGVVMPLLALFFLIFPPLSTYIGMAKPGTELYARLWVPLICGVPWFLLMIPLWRSIYTYLHVDKSGVTEKCPFRKSVEYPFSEFVDCGVVVYYDIPLIYLSKHVLTYGQKGGNRQQHDLIKWGEDALQLSYTKKAVRAIRTYAPPELYEMLCRDIERNPYIRKKYK